MNGDTFDAQGEARDALRTAVSSYGDRVLSDPRILGNLVTDLLPDSPRERSLLVTAAEAGVASELSQHVQQQRLDPDTAVSLVARGLTERRSIDIAASTWVATEYARALGYQVRAAAPPSASFDEDDAPGTATVRRPRSSSPTPPFPVPPSPVGQSPMAPPPFPQQPPQSPAMPPFPGQQSPGIPQSPQAPPMPFGQEPGYGQERGYQPTVFQAPPSQPSQPQSPYQPSSQPPAGFQQSSQPPSPYQPSSQPISSPPPAGPAGYQPPSYMQGPSQPQGFQQGPSQPQGFQQAPFPGVQGPTQPGQWGPQPPVRQSGSRKGLLWGGIGGGVVIIGVIIAVVLASSGGKGTPNANNTTTPPVVHTTPPVVHTTPPPVVHTLPAGITKLTSLLPSDINDFETECVNQTESQLPFKVTGLVQAVKCNDPGLPNGTVFAFQFDSPHDYVTSWQSFNKWWNFSAGTASNNCPPSGSGADIHGVNGWNSGQYPERSGQVVECQYVTSGTSSSTAASNLEPDYVWTYPTEYAFVDGQGAAGTSFSALQAWWHNT